MLLFLKTNQITIYIVSRTINRSAIVNLSGSFDFSFCGLFCLFKGYKLTKQGKSRARLEWKQIIPNTQTEKLLSKVSEENHIPNISAEHRLFQRQVSLFLLFFI